MRDSTTSTSAYRMIPKLTTNLDTLIHRGVHLLGSISTTFESTAVWRDP
mgnify:CR=1 FL=1